MTRRLITLAAAILAFALSASAQQIPEGYAVVDSVVFRPVALTDSSLAGRSVFSIMPSKAKGGKADVRIHQSDAIARAMRSYVYSNGSRPIAGYRVRIFSDNKQNARGASEAAYRRFCAGHPGIAAYRSFQTPFFRVTVGDFRSRSEAVELLDKIKGEFPGAFIVKEPDINYPVVDKTHAYVRDTVRVLRKVEP